MDLHQLWGPARDHVSGIALVVGVVLAALLLRSMLRRSMKRMVESGALQTRTSARLQTVLRWLTVALVGLLLLQLTGAVQQTWAVLSAAITTLAVGFVAMWSVLSNITCALLLLVFRPFRVDDEIELMDSDKCLAKGKVIDLNLMFVTLEGEEGVVHRVPNNLFVQKVSRVRRAGGILDPVDDRRSSFYSDPKSSSGPPTVPG